MSRSRALFPLLALTLLSPCLAAQSAISANELVRQTINNELAAAANPAHWMYLSRRVEDSKVMVREVIQTKGLAIERLLAVDDVTLAPAERVKEDRRIAELITNTGALNKLRRQQQEDTDKAQKMLELLPRAFLYEYAGHDGELTRLTFKPNPAFTPPTREARVFHAMAGELWVNERQQRLAKISGYLMQDVNFGFGLLGHLDQGGRFVVEMSEVAPRIWEATSMLVDMRGRALIFATINTQERENMSHFERVPDELSVAKAADMLLRTEYLARQH